MSENTFTGEIESKPKLKLMINNLLNNFHKFGLWVTLFLLLGCWIGISVSKKYYTDKMDEITTVGAFLHKSQVYQIIKK